ncbi:hypothetical protein ACE6H2_013154 [Prunus campanulata]
MEDTKLQELSRIMSTQWQTISELFNISRTAMACQLRHACLLKPIATEFSQHIIMCNIREARLAEVSASPYYYDKIHSARPVYPLVFPWYQYLLDTNRRPPPP